jgi:methionine-rich copper-binding protein CopC
MAPSNPKRMRISLAVRAFLLGLALLCLAAAPAFAAPQILSTDPEEGAELHQPPAQVSIEFSEPLEDSSDIDVTDDCGLRVDRGEAQISGTASNVLSIAIHDAPHHGNYTVHYVATGVTGTATGSYEFFVHGGVGCDGGGQGHDGHGGGGGDGDGGHDGGHDGGGGGHGGGGGTDHDGHDGTDGGDHDDTAGHDDMSSDHDGAGKHAEMGHKDMKHSDMKHPGKHKNRHDRHAQNGGGGPTLASGGDDVPVDIPTGTTVVIALSLAIVLGMLGGWVLRVSSPS